MKELTVEDHVQVILTELRMDAAGKIKIGYHLMKLCDNKKHYNIQNFGLFVEERLGITKPTAYRYIHACEHFSLKGEDGAPSETIAPEFENKTLKELFKLLKADETKPKRAKKHSSGKQTWLYEFGDWAELGQADFSGQEALKPGQKICIILSESE